LLRERTVFRGAKDDDDVTKLTGGSKAIGGFPALPRGFGPNMMCDAIVRQLACDWPPEMWRDVTVVLAVSGGADSVALLRGLLELHAGGAGRLVVAHFNHGLRGDASNADEAFVLELAGQFGLACERERWTVRPPALRGPGPEEAARNARYDFLRAAADRWGARYLATGHTADDQVETILHRIVRGTGLAGLAGIPRFRALSPQLTLVRPLLSLRRDQLEGYLKTRNQPFREDASNGDPRFTRNRIRHQLLPLLRSQFHVTVDDALRRLGTLAAEAQAYIAQQADTVVERAVQRLGPEAVQIDCSGLRGISRHLLRQVLVNAWQAQGWPEQEMGFAQWQLLAELVEREPGVKQTFPGQVVAERRGGQLLLSRDATSTSIRGA